MGMFVCDDCGYVENTALGLYWTRNNPRLWPEDVQGKALCSECAPTEFADGSPCKKFNGQWHGVFPKRLPVPGEKYENR